MKIQRNYRFAAAAILVAMLSHLSVVQAQNSVQAVMQVSVEVVSGATILSSFNEDISEQLYSNESSQIHFGEYTITVPKGAEFAATTEREVRMDGQAGSFTIQSKMAGKSGTDGSVTFEISGSANGSDLAAGHYSGRQIATVVYY
ncbi:MAG: hypothetical protein WD529_02245 [Balneolaceae bacterium]